MKRIRAAALLLALAVLWTQPVQAAEPILPQQTHLELSMAELEQVTFDIGAFQALCQEIQSQCTQRDNLDQVAALLRELRDSYLKMDTALTLCGLHSTQNAADGAVQAAYLEKLEESYQVEASMNQTVVTVMTSPCNGAVDHQDPVIAYFKMGQPTMTAQEQQLYLEEQTLVDQYYTASQGTFTAQIDGSDYTEPEAYDAYLQGHLTWEEYDQAALSIAMDQNDALADIYLALVENRRAQAALYDSEDFGLVADAMLYDRDYTRGEIAAFSGAVKTYIVPLVQELDAKMSDYAYRGDYDVSYTTEELLAMLRQGLTGISEELLDAADYMTEYGYYDIDPSPSKSEGAYTTLLSYPNAPFLMMQPENGPWDLSTLAHEFGHYNAFFCQGNAYVANYDLSEIHSQGLELLMTREYPALFGDRAEAMELYTIYAILTSLVDGCMMDELERYAYTQEDLTVEQLNRKYMDLMKDYGYREPDDPAEEGYSWVLTGHLFSNPLYYISYAVSAAGAFALWEQSRTDWDGAVETYLRLVALGEAGDFFPTLHRVGMDNPITPANVEALAVQVRQALDLDQSGETASVAQAIQERAQALLGQTESQEAGSAPAPKDLSPFKTPILVGVGLLVAADVVVLVVVLAIRRKEKRSNDKAGN